MYHRFYGLARLPFDVTPDPSLIYMSPEHQETLATLTYGVEGRKGFIVCTGEVGMGKTTVLRSYFDQTQSDDVKLIYIFSPKITPTEITKYILKELGSGARVSGFLAIQKLQMKLLELYTEGKTVALIIDEAQILPPDTLEHLRILSNLETDSEKLLQIVLVGQPELDEMLSRHEMRQVNQRVTLRSHIGPFSVDESLKYIEHRLVKTGANSIGDILSPGAALVIAQGSGGIPRRINILGDNVLIAGYGGQERPVSAKLARRVVDEFLKRSGMKPLPQSRNLFGWLKR